MAGPAIELLERLIKIAEAIAWQRAQISDQALRELRAEVDAVRHALTDGPALIGYEASFLLDCIAEIDDARRHEDARRRDRAEMYINTVHPFLLGDLARAKREVVR